MAFAAALNQRLVVGIGLQGKAAEKTVRFTVENLVQPGDEVVLVHVNVINPNYAATSASRLKQLKHMVAKRLAPLLDEHCVSFRVHTVHVTLPVFTSANPSTLVGDVLCTKAAEMHAAGVVVGGSGKDNLLLTVLLGHSISWTVKRKASVPVVLVGAQQPLAQFQKFVCRQLVDMPSLAKHGVVAAAA